MPRGACGKAAFACRASSNGPRRIPEPRVTNVPAFTSDIYPTLLELAGTTVAHQPPLDGISLVPLIDGQLTQRDRPLGFWVYESKGISTPSAKLMPALLQEQRGAAPATTFPERTPASRLETTFATSDLAGHATWIDGDWKLHRLTNARKGTATYELYHLGDDRAEAHDLAAREPARVRQMQAALHDWQTSVIHSLNGDDY